ncbi:MULTISPECIES: metal ABC transporter permease [Helcococcus]|uniref:Metal ABC transporter permease n=1 Tax=Helcococcus bovis TaxID=3153252 RepID=A0ABW9F3P8_9FIRM
MIDALLVLIFTAISCSLLGVFMVLRKLSMVTDAISHTVLLGIVLVFFFVNDLRSPLLIIGATVIGVLTVILIESLGNLKTIKYEDSIGVIYPVLFSIAVILISKYFRGVHLDTDIVLVGEVIFSSLEHVEILGLSISKSVLQSGLTSIIVVLYITFLFKELKATTFDKDFSKLIGINTLFIFYSLMTMSSFVSVISFEAVGGMLVISFFIAPAASALIITKDLKYTLLYTAIIATINCIIGYLLSITLNTSMPGMCAFVNMLTYILFLIYNKYRKEK